MRVLFVSSSPINTQTSIGNTFLNLFDGFDAELYSVYSRTGYPDKKIKSAFRIAETQLVKNIFNSKTIIALILVCIGISLVNSEMSIVKNNKKIQV